MVYNKTISKKRLNMKKWRLFMKRMKRAIALFMAVVMCFSVCPVSALAVTEPAETAATEPHP